MKQPKQEPLTFDMPFDEALERLARVNPRLSEVEATLELGRAAPFVKWAGGKRSIIDALMAALPSTFNQYWEPFAGGGALFFAIHDRLTSAILSDSNFDLMVTYSVVQQFPDALIAKLEEHGRRNNEAYYYRIRDQHELQDPIERAAQFIYLNKTCYNGLYRVNKRGEFNVPYGRYSNPDVVTKDNLLTCSRALQKAQIAFQEFEAGKPKPDDFVYCDPPYHSVSETANFTKYTKLGFSEKDQERLASFALKLHKRGVKIMLSNSDTPFIRKLYSNSAWHLTSVQAPRMVNCKPEGRGIVNELIITNYAIL